jgi:hypothetical protein
MRKTVSLLPILFLLVPAALAQDEPSVLFYSHVSGSGNSNIYVVHLPKDPPTLPEQDGKGGTFNIQLQQDFWFGMALCDTQSYPQQVSTCEPDSDANIFDGQDSTHSIVLHPGTAYMELQFSPPGWVPWPFGLSCDATHYCAAMKILSLSEDPVNGTVLNPTCADLMLGLPPNQLSNPGEYVNFAFITKSGVAQAPPNPLDSTLATFTPDPQKDLFMNPGDTLVVEVFDTPDGVKVVIHDRTTGDTGSMTASIANGFAQVLAAPTGTSCQITPYAFHPMYSTSSEHTRVLWLPHSSNIAFGSDIGHFEYCNAVDFDGGVCTQAGVNDPKGLDNDDLVCFGAASSTRIQIGGCVSGTVAFDGDTDFDGPSYGTNWPGTRSPRSLDESLNPRPVRFTSPLFRTSEGETSNYSRVAFETDLPVVETGTCNEVTGAGCANPPANADFSGFYPLFTTRQMQDGNNSCIWQLGGALIPGTTNTFGGTSSAEYGSLVFLDYIAFGGGGTIQQRAKNFRQVLNRNPCPVQEHRR